MIETEDQIAGEELSLDAPFPFRCGDHLTCFNRCCRHKRLPLFPYDLLRLRRSLGAPSAQVLERHVDLELDPRSGWPAPRIRLRSDGRCPFVGAAGCGVYAHRPFCCRIYPLARMVAPRGTDGPPRERFVASRPEGCLGLDAPQGPTVRAYLEQQGLGPYREANNRILRLLLHPARSRPMALSDRQLHAFIMTLYNLDTWRSAVAAPGFAPRYGLTRERLERALTEDRELLDLGQDWLTAQLFGP